jgi:hypothetical protein
MFHETLDKIVGRITGINVHGNNVLTVINNTQMTLMVLVKGTLVDFAEIQDIHHTEIGGGKDDMTGTGVFRK